MPYIQCTLERYVHEMKMKIDHDFFWDAFRAGCRLVGAATGRVGLAANCFASSMADEASTPASLGARA